METMFADYHGLTHLEIAERLLAMALAEVPDRMRRNCEAVDDPAFLLMGLRRVLEQRYVSGREFIQSEQMAGDELARSTYFATLASPRRRALAEAVEEELRAKLSRWLALAGVNHLALFPELAGRAVFAADGHYIEHACHSPRDEKGRQVAFGNIFANDLSTGLLFPVCAILAGHSMHPNEWALLKQATKKLLRKMGMSRQGWDSGRRPLLIYDRAGADANFMVKEFLARNGFDMITRAKENMRFEVLAKLPFDKADKFNAGVLLDELVKLANGAALRRVTFKCLESGTVYEFLATERKLRPGVVALLYLMRWRIEKVFDVSEQKLGQDKAWSSSGPAGGPRPCQADFVSMAYNTMVFVKAIAELDGGAKGTMVEAKRERELELREEVVEAHNAELWDKAKRDKSARKPRGLRPLHPLLAEVVQQWHQMTCQFIRCFRGLFHSRKTLAECFCWYSRYLEKYL